MRTLKKRLRPDTIPNQTRRPGIGRGRLVYLGLLGAICALLGDHLLGPFLFLRAEGLVLRKRNVVAVTYVARVASVEVTEGQRVRPGQTILRLQSTEMLQRLADLSARRAELTAKATELKSRSATTSQLLPLALQREEQAAKVIRDFDAIAPGGFVSSVRYEEALRARYGAREASVQLQAQNQVLQEELTSLENARRDADAALADLRIHYGDGVVAAPAEGNIGETVPSAGNVYRPGEPILTVHAGEPYVLVYLSSRYLFAVHQGTGVCVSDGRTSAPAAVVEILPVADALPPEFQNTFKPRERGQLAKVHFDAAPQFPLHAKVEVTRRNLFGLGCGFG
jgi:hypothetical protein